MKVTFDVDCTPEEARRFIGLPDLSSIHEIYLDQMRKAVSEGLSPDYFIELTKNWGSMGEGAFTVWKSMLEQMGGGKR